MAESYRPLRTIKALAKFLGPRWADVDLVELEGLKLQFRTSKPAQQQNDSWPDASLPAAPALPPSKEQDPLGPVDMADLVLEPPAGMINPALPPRDEPN